MTPYPRHSDPYAARWKMPALISLGFVAMTLNWFDIAPAFPAIGTEFHTNISRTAFLLSASARRSACTSGTISTRLLAGAPRCPSPAHPPCSSPW